jgi:transposase
MAKRIGPAKVKKYCLEFKLKAVQLSGQPGVLMKDVAESLCIHPFMLSKWRKQVRDGELAGDPPPLEPRRPRSCSGCARWRGSSSAFRWSTTC